MILPTRYSGKTVAILGLGKSGLSAERALKAAGAQTLVWDDKSDRDDLVDLQKADWSEIDLLVMSPGIPHLYPKPHPVALLAKEAGVEIVCDVELLCKTQNKARYVAITGTNGKSTTTALVHHILKECDKAVQIGGNFGIPALDMDPLDEEGIYVLEMSSYQLERTPSLKANVAIWLNISPDHIERHGNLAGYVAAKRNIFNNQTTSDFALIGCDDDESLKVMNDVSLTKAQVIPVSTLKKPAKSLYLEDHKLIDGYFEDVATAILPLDNIATLKGVHNAQNAILAYGACRALGLKADEICRAIANFPGLAHRQEIVATFNDVLFINDSKATNADASARALNAYENIYWIIGGQAKEGGISSLIPLLKNVRKSYLIGESMAEFAKTLTGHGVFEECQTLERAVQKAYADAKGQKGVILLSPACASWDQFKSFEHRGDIFKSIVHQLEKEVA